MPIHHLTNIRPLASKGFVLLLWSVFFGTTLAYELERRGNRLEGREIRNRMTNIETTMAMLKKVANREPTDFKSQENP